MVKYYAKNLNKGLMKCDFWPSALSGKAAKALPPFSLLANPKPCFLFRNRKPCIAIKFAAIPFWQTN